MSTAVVPAIDMNKLNAFLGQFVNDLGATVHTGMVACSRSQEVGLCLGAQAGEARIQEVVTSAGFHRFRRAIETPFNIVYEARP